MKWRKFPKKPTGSESNQYLCLKEGKKGKLALVCRYEDYSDYGETFNMVCDYRDSYEPNFFDFWIPVEEVLDEISYGKLK